MAASGWYPDPEHRADTERYWDGEQWTETRATAEAVPQGWYPDPEHKPNTERYWDGEEWWNTRPAAQVKTPPPPARRLPQRSGVNYFHRLLIKLGVAALTSFVGLFVVDQRLHAEPSEPRWSGQDCVQAVFDELSIIRSEVEFPTMTTWDVDRNVNPVLDAATTSEERCGPGSRTIRGFDWANVQEDYDALRGHLQWNRARPKIEDLTPLEEIEAELN